MNIKQIIVIGIGIIGAACVSLLPVHAEFMINRSNGFDAIYMPHGVHNLLWIVIALVTLIIAALIRDRPSQHTNY